MEKKTREDEAAPAAKATEDKTEKEDIEKKKKEQDKKREELNVEEKKRKEEEEKKNNEETKAAVAKATKEKTEREDMEKKKEEEYKTEKEDMEKKKKETEEKKNNEEVAATVAKATKDKTQKEDIERKKKEEEEKKTEEEKKKKEGEEKKKKEEENVPKALEGKVRKPLANGCKRGVATTSTPKILQLILEMEAGDVRLDFEKFDVVDFQRIAFMGAGITYKEKDAIIVFVYRLTTPRRARHWCILIFDPQTKKLTSELIACTQWNLKVPWVRHTIPVLTGKQAGEAMWEHHSCHFETTSVSPIVTKKRSRTGSKASKTLTQPDKVSCLDCGKRFPPKGLGGHRRGCPKKKAAKHDPPKLSLKASDSAGGPKVLVMLNQVQAALGEMKQLRKDEKTPKAPKTSESGGDLISQYSRMLDVQAKAKNTIDQEFVLKLMDKTERIATAVRGSTSSNSTALETGLQKLGDLYETDMANMAAVLTVEALQKKIAQAEIKLSFKESMAVQARFAVLQKNK